MTREEKACEEAHMDALAEARLPHEWLALNEHWRTCNFCGHLCAAEEETIAERECPTRLRSLTDRLRDERDEARRERDALLGEKLDAGILTHRLLNVVGAARRLLSFTSPRSTRPEVRALRDALSALKES